MAEAARKEPYPYIERNPEIAEGAPIIEGTRVTVRTIAGYYQMGMSVDEILNALTHLTPARVHSALAFYFDHQEEIDRDLAESSDTESWEGRALKHPDEGSSGT